MIIGINGKIGSGKDTIGNIIQYLTDENVKDMSFKDWYASNVYSVYQVIGKWEIKKFAGKLKETASLLTGIDIEKFEDQDFKKQEMPEEWWYWSNTDKTTTKIPYTEQTKILAKSDSDIVLYKTTYREFLQKLGTDAVRDGLHKDAWVNALFADYYPTNDCQQHADGLFYTDEHGENEVLPEYPNWIITDMRFPNEMEAAVERKGITIRVTSPFIRFSDGSYRAKSKMMGDFNNEHPSETSLDGAKFDYEIINDAGISELIEKVRQILTIEKII